MKFGLFVKPHVSNKKLILITTKALKIKNFFDFRSSRHRYTVEKDVLTFANFSLFLIKLQIFSALQLY